MKSDSFQFESLEGQQIFVHKWLEEGESPRGVVQIAHGMAEHSGRYERFARELVKNGYIVYAHDHRGHGRTAGLAGEMGHFSDDNGWNLVVEDMYQLTGIIREEYPDLPIFLFGHSMGSLLSRDYISKYGQLLTGVILAGTVGDPGFAGRVGTFLARLERKLMGTRKRSVLINKLSFGGYNKTFQPARTEFDWLSRDKNEVDNYIDDPYCGNPCSTGFYYDLLSGIQSINKMDNINKVPKDLPIYFISGEQDPAGEMSKGVLGVYQKYKKAGLKEIRYKFYPEARHELLNEINRQEVFQDIINWLNKH